MPLLDAVRLALQQIRVQKLKSFFTLLGVTIGVMFLIAVVSVVNGMGRYVERDFAGKFLGVNTFNLRKKPDIGGDFSEDEWKRMQRRPAITAEDAIAVRDGLPASARWAIQDLRWDQPTTRYAKGGPQVLVEAATPGLFAIKDLVVRRGRAFGEQEESTGANVAVIGQEVADLYFPGLDPIGRDVIVERQPFQVVGVLDKQGSVFGVSLDRQIIAPFTSAMHRATRSRENGLYGVVVQGANPAEQVTLQETVRELMRRRHKLHPGAPDDFTLESSETALAQWLALKKYLVLAGVALPAIGLVVGAIVIMNIMLVAVAERTREIGVRKSLGARRRDILGQFLAESTALSVAGAGFGVALGVALAAVVRTATPLPTEVAMWSVLVSVGLGAGVGIVAGVYPASRAARLDPIVALRSE